MTAWPLRFLSAVLTVTLGAGLVAVLTRYGDGAPSAQVVVQPSRLPTPVAAPSKATLTRHRPVPTPAPKPRPPLLYPLPARAVAPQPCPPPPRPPGKPLPPMPPPAVKASALPAPLPVRHRNVDLASVGGKGMWLTTWADSRVDVTAVVNRARQAGLRQLWVRTGGSNQGWYGERLLSRLLPAAHAAGIKVIAWDFPTLSDPVADARRAGLALRGTFAGQRIDGLSPDIETTSERVYSTAQRMRVYLSVVRRYAGSRPIVATVPRPTPERLASYPYAAQRPYVDAYAPMVYWSCNEPGALVAESVRALRRLRPVHLVGQSYDMGPEGGRQGLPSGREIWRFLDASRRAGGIGASLYVYDETRARQWRALAGYPWS